MDDDELLRRAMLGVKPMGPRLPARPKRAQAAAAPPARVAPPPAEAARPRGQPGSEGDALRLEIARLAARVESLEAELAAASAAATARAAAPEGATTLGDALAARGLVGRDEMAAALRALLDARREDEILGAPLAGTAADVAARVAGRLLLLADADADAAPPGMVALRVAAGRSESPDAPAVRAAARKLTTACLLRGTNEIVFAGGMPAHQRVVRAAVDPRVSVRFVGAEAAVRSGVRVPWPESAGAAGIVAAIEAATRAVEGK